MPTYLFARQTNGYEREDWRKGGRRARRDGWEQGTAGTVSRDPIYSAVKKGSLQERNILPDSSAARATLLMATSMAAMRWLMFCTWSELTRASERRSGSKRETRRRARGEKEREGEGGKEGESDRRV